MWKGPIKENDRQQQIDLVRSFVTEGVSGIVLAPLDRKALSGPVSTPNGRSTGTARASFASAGVSPV